MAEEVRNGRLSGKEVAIEGEWHDERGEGNIGSRGGGRMTSFFL